MEESVNKEEGAPKNDTHLWEVAVGWCPINASVVGCGGCCKATAVTSKRVSTPCHPTVACKPAACLGYRTKDSGCQVEIVDLFFSELACVELVRRSLSARRLAR